MKKLRGAIVGYGFIMEKGHAAAYRDRATSRCRDRDDLDVATIAVRGRVALLHDEPVADDRPAQLLH